ncbi:hypothetical protein BP5796_07874 [Coleophoma crateriformis]|uniref:Heterokaryon incompatibility domain-containing protein n=1 Tax=Coleophoma crateriformis TaxID=565419 RepID=A0A3D8RCZ1_9HELO|nr:hypothetical protein BP5796_07874 [Coleophoma crateriformis]
MIPPGAGMGISGVRVNVGGAEMMKEVDLKITAAPDDPLALSGDITGRSARCEPGSSESFSRIQEWLSICEQTHTQCSSPFIKVEAQIHTEIADNSTTSNVATFPSRLIDVESDADPKSLRLWETTKVNAAGDIQRTKGRYSALSYSWGPEDSKRFTTKKDTREARLKGFSLEELPTTIRDAVVLTRKLGLRYLWVDALCIVQDDVDDWAEESARINEVYGNAVITIAAAACEDKWDGIFRKWDLPPSQSVSIHSKCSNDDRTGTMTISDTVGSLYEILDRSPLSNRAWVLQERVLSRRTIHFAKDQMYWECQNHAVAEDGTIFSDTFSVNKYLSWPGGVDSMSIPSGIFINCRTSYLHLLGWRSNFKIVWELDETNILQDFGWTTFRWLSYGLFQMQEKNSLTQLTQTNGALLLGHGLQFIGRFGFYWTPIWENIVQNR